MFSVTLNLNKSIRVMSHLKSIGCNNIRPFSFVHHEERSGQSRNARLSNLGRKKVGRNRLYDVPLRSSRMTRYLNFVKKLHTEYEIIADIQLYLETCTQEMKKTISRMKYDQTVKVKLYSFLLTCMVILLLVGFWKLWKEIRNFENSRRIEKF